MNEARTNLLKAAALSADWEDWARPTPGLYTYNAETSEPERLTDLHEEGAELLAL